MPSTVTPFTSPPPTNQGAEQVCLAATFTNPEQVGIKPDHCVDPVHTAILRTAQAQIARGTPITPASLAADLGSVLDEIGGPAYLTQLEALAPTPDAVAEASGQVRDAWQRREMISLGERLQQIGTEAVQDAFGFTSRASANDQAHRLILQVAQAMRTCFNIVASAPATAAQDVGISGFPGCLPMQVTPLEMEHIAALNAHFSVNALATGTDRIAARRWADLYLARSDVFRKTAEGAAPP